MAPGQAAIGSWNSMAAMGIAESVCRLSLGMGLTHCRGIFLFAHGAWALSTKAINNNLKYYYCRRKFIYNNTIIFNKMLKNCIIYKKIGRAHV
jgi:hypothetical protein